MHRIAREFISQEKRDYPFKLGQVLASALTGFVVGVVTASVVWMLAVYYINSFLLQ